MKRTFQPSNTKRRNITKKKKKILSCEKERLFFFLLLLQRFLRLNLGELSLHLTGAHAYQIVKLSVSLFKPCLRFFEHVGKAVEFLLHAAQHLPDLSAALLDSQSAEAHL